MDFSKGVWAPWKELLTKASEDLGLDVKLEGCLRRHFQAKTMVKHPFIMLHNG